ncbi:hypothetical protein Dthio_PD0732 [Desulfonatronospira thiodismutans ASO3-1]|uniref:Uncharacterized protein n=1 Tax=Desulfonatronospira thiodismutans ASO3-1 TaxID=555779 RepID=D6SRT5_9BACT|nr:hypothetical protein [Desulfonatronospira thiodismutans]EFI33401.1 hypothetical protein Dthio_PD0732 [Desulfonatronospira thiodismutans ASO3-1]
MNGKNSCGVKKKSGISAEYWSLITEHSGNYLKGGVCGIYVYTG